MHVSQIKETCLYVQDLNRTAAFYHEKLDLEIISKSEGRHIFFRAGASVLLCFKAEATRREETLPVHYGEGKMHLAFEVPKEEYQQVKAWIQAQGITVEHEQEWAAGVYSFYFRDPDGHSLEVVPEGMWD